MKNDFLRSRYFFFDILFFSVFFYSFLFFYEISPLSAVFLIRKELLKFSIKIRLIFTNQLIFYLFSSISLLNFLKPASVIVFSESFSSILDFHFFLREKFFFLLAICFKGFFINVALFDSFYMLLNKDKDNFLKIILNFYGNFFFILFFFNFNEFFFQIYLKKKDWFYINEISF
jgi:hypothetical protein